MSDATGRVITAVLRKGYAFPSETNHALQPSDGGDLEQLL